MSNNLSDQRCQYCNKLLFKFDSFSYISIKCERCKSINNIKGGNNDMETNLKNEVIEIIKDESEGEEKTYMEDVMNHGCVSGHVGALIYYNDTVAFFERHKQEINDMLQETLEMTGFDSPYELFGDKWDKDDYLLLENYNKNLLAWFAFEETTRKIYEEKYGGF